MMSRHGAAARNLVSLALWLCLPVMAQDASVTTEPKSSASILKEAERLAQADSGRAISIAQSELDAAMAADDDATRASALRVLAIANYFRADFPAALGHAVEAEGIFRDLGQLDKQASLLSLMGAVHGSSKQPERALEVYERALAVSRKAGKHSGVAIVMMNLGKTHYDLGDFDLSVRRYEESLGAFELATESGEVIRPDALLFARMGIADALLRQGNTAQAIERGQAVLEASDPESLVFQNALAIVGEAYLESADLDAAENYLVRARDEAVRTNRPAKQAETLLLLARLAEAREQFKEALALQRSANDLNLEIFNERNSSEMARLESRYESDLQEQRIALQSVELARSRTTVFATSAVAIAALVLAAIAFKLYRVTRKSQRALRVLAETDPLTRLLNRRTMYEYLRPVSDRADDSMQASLFLLDVDDFKEINDRYGHAVGDKVLVRVAETLGKTTRASDRIARWGGEEFLVLLEGRSPSEALAVAQRVRDAIAHIEVPFDDDQSIQPTVSIGVTQIPPGTDNEESIRRADAAMYQAKLQGKNCVAVFDEDGDAGHLEPVLA